MSRPGCAAIQEQASSWLDDELGADARRRVKDHLAGCATCRRAVREMKLIRTAAVDATPEPSAASAGVAGRVRATLAGREARARRGHVLRRCGVIAAAGLFGFLSVVVAYRLGRSHERAETTEGTEAHRESSPDREVVRKGGGRAPDGVPGALRPIARPPEFTAEASRLIDDSEVRDEIISKLFESLGNEAPARLVLDLVEAPDDAGESFVLQDESEGVSCRVEVRRDGTSVTRVVSIVVSGR